MMIWKCHICRWTRPDNKISVHSFPWRDKKGKIIQGGTVNVRYCNDRPKCFTGAKKKEKEGRL